MSEPHRRPSLPRVLWLERDRPPPPPPVPEPPAPPQLFRPKSPVRERLFPSARPVAQAIVRVPAAQGGGLRLLLRPPEPVRRTEPEEDHEAHAPRRPRGMAPAGAGVPGAAGRDWLRLGSRREGLTLARILAVVAEHYGVCEQEILAHRRASATVIPRQVAMYLARALTGRSLPDIGRRFGGRDHTTILHGVRKIAALMEVDPMLAREVEAIAGRLRAPGEGRSRLDDGRARPAEGGARS